MKKNGPIIYVDDDTDDLELIGEIYRSLDYSDEIITFNDSTKVLPYLRATGVIPLLIISDVNMPLLNGYELREQIAGDDELHLNCVPFIFFSTAQSLQVVADAYSRSIQGFFEKAGDYEALRRRLKLILDYWTDALSPGNAFYR